MRRIFISLAGFAILFAFMAAPVQSTLPPTMVAMTTMTTPTLQSQPQPEAKTFTGTILKSGDDFVLSETATKSRYTLDNAEKASPYEGKTVKVTGTFDVASNLIHIETIQEIA